MDESTAKLPTGWKFARLDSFVRFNRNSLPETTPPDKEIRYIDLAAVKAGRIKFPLPKYTFRDAPSRARRVFACGDILMSMIRPNLLGHALINFDAPNAVCSTGFAVLTPRSSEESEFIYQQLYSHAIRSQIHARVTGSGYPALSAKDAGSIRLATPSDAAERKSIGRLLHAYDEHNHALADLIRSQRTRRRGLRQQLLSGANRFPEFIGKPWREVHVGDVLREVARSQMLDPATPYRLVSIRRRSGGFFDREVRKGHQIGYPSLQQIHAGDFVIARRQVLHGAMAMVPSEFHGAFVSNAYAILEAHDPTDFHVPFFNFISQQPHLYHLAYRCSYGVAIEKMFFRLDWFLKDKLLIPPTLAEQEKITAVLAVADREIALLEGQLAALREQKKGLMQKLLTGQVRIKGAIHAV